MRIWKSHSLANLINNYLIDSPEPSNTSYLWKFGSLLVFFLVFLILYICFFAPVIRCDYMSQEEINSFVLNIQSSFNDFLQYSRNNPQISGPVSWNQVICNANYFPNPYQSINTFTSLIGPVGPNDLAGNSHVYNINRHAFFICMDLGDGIRREILDHDNILQRLSRLTTA
jgi:hypothetical protein